MVGIAPFGRSVILEEPNQTAVLVVKFGGMSAMWPAIASGETRLDWAGTRPPAIASLSRCLN